MKIFKHALILLTASIAISGCVTTTPETVVSMSSQHLCSMLGPRWISTPNEQAVMRSELSKRGVVCDYGHIVGQVESGKSNQEIRKTVPVTSTGTGFIVSKDGVIVTAYHVIADKNKIEVQCGNKSWHTASIDRFSVGNDVALLNVDLSTDKWIPLISADIASVGDEVYTVGYPVVEVLGPEPKYTNGVLSSKSGIKGDQSFMQTTTPVQPGNSGGPLILKKKGVIGVIVSTAAVAEFYQTTSALPQNVNWSTKSDYVGLLQSSILVSPRTKLAVQDVIEATCLVRAK